MGTAALEINLKALTFSKTPMGCLPHIVLWYFFK